MAQTKGECREALSLPIAVGVLGMASCIQVYDINFVCVCCRTSLLMLFAGWVCISARLRAGLGDAEHDNTGGLPKIAACQ